jgi:CheY-like chemotaxis protein
VLIVDDNVDSVTLLRHILEERGYAVQAAYNGPDGLQVARQWCPDAVLLDIGLPGLDGYEVARRLRSVQLDEADGGKRFEGRIIAVTGYGGASDIVRSREAGFDAHLAKPFELDELERLLVHRKEAEP